MQGITGQRKKSVWLLLGWLVFFAPGAANAFTFGDIECWVGTGSNQAGFAVDWNDGINPVSLAWGYRWDGTAYGVNMLLDIAGSGYIKDAYDNPPKEYLTGDDTRLYACISDWGWDPPLSGYTVFGLGYDVDGDGGGFVSGYENDSPPDYPGENGHALDTDDHYKEGWYSGSWSYWLSTSTNPWQGADWTNHWKHSGLGMGSRELTDGCWDGWSFAAGSATAPDEPVTAAVPEPTTLALLGFGLLGIGWWKKQRPSQRIV